MPADTPLIDVHSHLLSGIDDGATDLGMSLDLVHQGLEDGIGTWVLTPHVVEVFDEEIDRIHYAAYERLRNEVAKRELPVELVMASEIMFQADAKAIRARRTSTFGDNKKYFLMEFPMAFFPGEAENVLFDFQMAGMTPIIAHPERNGGLAQQRTTVENMVSRGILMQVNARSLAPKVPAPTRHVAEWLIVQGLAHFVASDAHHPEARPAVLREAFDRVAELTDEATARRLCIENPRAAIEGEKIQTVMPEVPENRRWWKRIADRLIG